MTDTKAHPPSTGEALMEVTFGGHSMCGTKARNDDAFAAHIPPSKHARRMKGAVACIADGISVSDRSHLASQLAVTQFIDDYFSTPDSWGVEEAASRVLRALNDWLCSQSRHNQTSAMVTTFSSVIIKSTSLHVFHVGDSRIFRIRGRTIEPITRDHSLNLGSNDSVLTASLGMDPRLAVDYSCLDLEVGDIILLATDGVTNTLSPAKLLAHLGDAAASLDVIAQTICEAALENGSADNLTCGLARIDSLPIESINEAHQRVQTLKIPPVMQPGNSIDGYKVLSVLHNGTRSHIYKVKCDITDENYILKVPSLNFQDDPVYLDAFIREQWVGRRLNHPGLMRVFPARGDSPFLYLVSEHIKGQTLRQWMLDNPTPALSDMRDIIGQVITALRKMHRMGMVHRDIKPENIMITPQGDIKIIDFGAVSVAGMDDISSPIREARAVGSVNYSAPELIMDIKGRAQSRSQADIYALGVLAYELLTGKRPYSDKSKARRKLASYAMWQYRSARQRRRDIPDWVDLALEKACAPNPEKRYLAMSEFWEDLTRPSRDAKRQKAHAPLLERNPLAFWKGLALLSLGLSGFLLFLLLQTNAG